MFLIVVLAIAGVVSVVVAAVRPLIVKFRPMQKTVVILSGLTILACLLAVGTFDEYVALVATALLLATLITGEDVPAGVEFGDGPDGMSYAATSSPAS